MILRLSSSRNQQAAVSHAQRKPPSRTRHDRQRAKQRNSSTIYSNQFQRWACVCVGRAVEEEDWFRTTAAVRQRCLLSPTLFNIFLERIMTDALEDHEGTVSTGGRTITHLLSASDIEGLAGEEEELAKLVECLDKAFSLWHGDQCREDQADDN